MTTTLRQTYASPEIASTPVRLAYLLAIAPGQGFDEVALARRVMGGLPVESLAVLRDLFGTEGIVGPVIAEATLRRALKAGKPLSREASDRLYDLSRVVDAVARAYHGDRDRVIDFMRRPHPLLDGETPLALALSSSAGSDAVLNLLRRAEAGVAL